MELLVNGLDQVYPRGTPDPGPSRYLLGPIPFLLFVNDMPNVRGHFRVHVFLLFKASLSAKFL